MAIGGGNYYANSWVTSTNSTISWAPTYTYVEAPAPTPPAPKVDPDIAWLRGRVQEMCDASGMAA